MLRLPEAEAAATRRRRRRGRRRRRDDDHQHGAAAPVAPTACCASCSSSRARRCCAPSRSSATSTPAWRRRARSSRTSRAAPTSPAWTTCRPLFNELVFSLADEKLLGIEVPAAGHVDPHAACASSTGSRRTCCSWPPTAWTSAPSSMMIYGWREREVVLRFFEKVTGLRMNHNYIRPGGVAADLPDGLARRRAAAPRRSSRRGSTSTTPC